MWFFFMKQLIPQKVIYDNGCAGRKKPEYRVQKADLPFKIIWQIGIIPYVPPEPYIDNQACDQFKSCDDKR